MLSVIYVHLHPHAPTVSMYKVSSCRYRSSLDEKAACCEPSSQLLDSWHASPSYTDSQEDGSSELEEEVASGLQLYFDKALGQMLLYAIERPQYDEQVPTRPYHATP